MAYGRLKPGLRETLFGWCGILDDSVLCISFMAVFLHSTLDSFSETSVAHSLIEYRLSNGELYMSLRGGSVVSIQSLIHDRRRNISDR
jgi:hypothetical protein